MQLAYLSEAQNAAFDYQYHAESELLHKLKYLRSAFPGGPKRILDIGGGNGVFMDRLLAEFPDCEGHVLDVSAELLRKNAIHPRKFLVQGSLAQLGELVPKGHFDVVTINWVLHHVVGPSYAESVEAMGMALKLAQATLKKGGVIYVAENEYDGFLGTNLPSHIIYHITRRTSPLFVRLASPFFNTAGVGVCFQSKSAWLHHFSRLGYFIDDYFHFDRWQHSFRRRALFSLLFLRGQWHGHYALRLKNV